MNLPLLKNHQRKLQQLKFQQENNNSWKDTKNYYKMISTHFLQKQMIYVFINGAGPHSTLFSSQSDIIPNGSWNHVWFYAMLKIYISFVTLIT